MSTVRFIHLRDKHVPTGGITIALEMIDDTHVHKFAIARCHEHDNYNKRVGRAKAGGRLNSRTQSILLDERTTMGDVIEYVKFHFASASS